MVGGLAASVFWAGHALGFPAAVGAAWTLVASLLLTGGLHEDGLADTADGFGGGNTRTRKLEIMRDSRIGSYGASALMLSLGIRGASVAALRQPEAVFSALVAAGALGRGALLGLLCLLRPARQEGLGASLGRIRPLASAVGLALAVACAMALGGSRGMAAITTACVAALVVAALAWRQVGGYTGDVLGAGEQVVECAVLTILAGLASG